MRRARPAAAAARAVTPRAQILLNGEVVPDSDPRAVAIRRQQAYSQHRARQQAISAAYDRESGGGGPEQVRGGAGRGGA
jgi:hypothetical protein